MGMGQPQKLGHVYRVYCIPVPGHDPLIFSFLSFSFFIGWEFYGPNYLKC